MVCPLVYQSTHEMVYVENYTRVKELSIRPACKEQVLYMSFENMTLGFCQNGFDHFVPYLCRLGEARFKVCRDLFKPVLVGCEIAERNAF